MERRRRRAVGPAGAQAGRIETSGRTSPPAEDDLRDEGERERDDEDRLQRERPPHHDPR